SNSRSVRRPPTACCRRRAGAAGAAWPKSPKRCSPAGNLKRQLEPYLGHTRRAGAPDLALDTAKGAAGEAIVRGGHIGVIQQVEKFHAEIQGEAFGVGDADILGHRQIGVDVGGPTELVAGPEKAGGGA